MTDARRPPSSATYAAAAAASSLAAAAFPPLPSARSRNTIEIVFDTTDFYSFAAMSSMAKRFGKDEVKKSRLLSIQRTLSAALNTKVAINQARILEALNDLNIAQAPQFSAYCQHLLCELMRIYRANCKDDPKKDGEWGKEVKETIDKVFENYQGQLFSSKNNNNIITVFRRPAINNTILLAAVFYGDPEFLKKLIAAATQADDSGTLLAYLLRNKAPYQRFPLMVAAQQQEGVALVEQLMQEKISQKLTQEDWQKFYTEPDDHGFFLLMAAITPNKKNSDTAIVPDTQQEKASQSKALLEMLLTQAEKVVFANDRHDVNLSAYAACLTQFNAERLASAFNTAVKYNYESVIALFINRVKNVFRDNPAVAKEIYQAWLGHCKTLRQVDHVKAAQDTLTRCIAECEAPPQKALPPTQAAAAVPDVPKAVAAPVSPPAPPVAPPAAAATEAPPRPLPPLLKPPAERTVQTASTAFAAMEKSRQSSPLKEGLKAVKDKMKEYVHCAEANRNDPTFHQALQPLLDEIKKHLTASQFSEYLQYLISDMLLNERQYGKITVFLDAYGADLFSSGNRAESVVWVDPTSKETLMTILSRCDNSEASILARQVLDRAETQENQALLETLLFTPNQNYTPLALASAQEVRLDLVTALLTASQSLDPKDRQRHLKIKGGQYGYTPLHLAAFLKNTATAKKLLEAANDEETMSDLILAQSKRGDTPLIIAAQEKHAELVSALLEKMQGKPGYQKTLTTCNQYDCHVLHVAVDATPTPDQSVAQKEEQVIAVLQIILDHAKKAFGRSGTAMDLPAFLAFFNGEDQQNSTAFELAAASNGHAGVTVYFIETAQAIMPRERFVEWFTHYALLALHRGAHANETGPLLLQKAQEILSPDARQGWIEQLTQWASPALPMVQQHEETLKQAAIAQQQQQIAQLRQQQEMAVQQQLLLAQQAAAAQQQQAAIMAMQQGGYPSHVYPSHGYPPMMMPPPGQFAGNPAQFFSPQPAMPQSQASLATRVRFYYNNGMAVAPPPRQMANPGEQTGYYEGCYYGPWEPTPPPGGRGGR
jgi:hypothetical protein